MINFPNSPASGTEHTEGGKTWRFNGTAWVGIGSTTISWANIIGKPAFGSAAYTDSNAYASSEQGATADSASQPGHLHSIAEVTNLQAELSGKASAAHDHALADLTQSGALAGQVPVWDGTAWMPSNPTNASYIQKSTADAVPVNTIRCMTQGEYDALGTYDPDTLYFIK